MNDNPQPIKDYHIVFARAVVALAREHGVGDVRLKFRRASSTMMRRGEYHWDATEVSLTWHEGRHGSEDQIKLELRAEAISNVPEKEGPEA